MLRMVLENNSGNRPHAKRASAWLGPVDSGTALGRVTCAVDASGRALWPGGESGGGSRQESVLKGYMHGSWSWERVCGLRRQLVELGGFLYSERSSEGDQFTAVGFPKTGSVQKHLGASALCMQKERG